MGGLMQLVAYGVNDSFLISHDGSLPYNHRDSTCHWFIDSEDGHARHKDVNPRWFAGSEYWMDDRDIPDVLAHVPQHSRPAADSLVPFRVSTERASTKIQKAWRNAIANPKFKMCFDRLTKEYNELRNFLCAHV